MKVVYNFVNNSVVRSNGTAMFLFLSYTIVYLNITKLVSLDLSRFSSK